MEYIVERTLPGFTAEQVGSAAARAKAAASEMTRQGIPVRYRRSVYLPTEEKCFCLFEAPSQQDVLDANKRAGLPVDRILEAVYVASEDLG